MDKNISRRSFLKKILQISYGAALLGAIGHIYVKYIEPNWLEITRLTISHPLIPPVFNNFKIVQLSDTHFGFQLDEHQFKKIIQTISSEKPDVIIFSGDLVDNLLSFFEYDPMVAFLSHLSAPFGKFAVYGNHDHGGWGTEKYQEVMSASDYILLKNEAYPVQMNGDEIFIAGIDEPILGKPNLQKTFQNHDRDKFTILISHAPDLAEEAKFYPAHLQLSGHTHGGQVQLPFFGPFITPPFGQKYTEGLYKISNDFFLYVNRGLGTTRLPYRFLARPEITVFTLTNIDKKEKNDAYLTKM